MKNSSGARLVVGSILDPTIKDNKIIQFLINFFLFRHLLNCLPKLFLVQENGNAQKFPVQNQLREATSQTKPMLHFG